VITRKKFQCLKLLIAIISIKVTPLKNVKNLISAEYNVNK